ncbi:hypothetical protein LUZ60_000538 [Juncus effusus]|nr:hypothetical protein LUZ60_000538 [Juncus effusus]
MKETKVVLYPTMGVGHLRPMIELAKLFASHGVSITIAIISLPSSHMDFISKVSLSNPKISFHFLSPPSDPLKPHPEPFVNMLNTLRFYTPQLESFLKSESEISSISALVFDFFCIDSIDMAAKLGIPGYIFYPSGASDLAALLQVPSHISTINGTMKDSKKTPLVLHGVPPLRPSDFPKELGDPELDTYKAFYPILERMPDTKGVLVNTFELLEPRAVRALKDGLCTPNRVTPPIYCVGPLTTGGGDEEVKEKHRCLTWLDSQPKQSVVFLCFGSEGTLLLEQLREMAIGLEKSGQRFLWVVRDPHNRSAEPDLDELLPEGFLDRTKDRGMVVKLWAPQVEVLRHMAVGGFVSHCGWNSTMEAVTAGVPIICWPLYAEQKLNKVFLVEEMKIGVVLRGYEEGLVTADELEKKIRWLMESEGGKEMRNRILVDKENAILALKEGGSSESDFVEFLGNLKI